MRFIPLLALLALAAPAAAQDAQPAPEKKICRRSGPATGSIMPARPVCHTKAEWASIDAANRKSTDSLIDRARQSGVGRN